MTHTKLRELTTASVMAALIFLFTFTLKLPGPSGYTHLGDAFIFLALFLLDWKYAALAAGIGAALADLAGGYPYWAAPTFFIKAGMVVIAWLFLQKVFHGTKWGRIPALVLGGLFQLTAYTAVKYPLVGAAYAWSSLPTLAVQTAIGITAALVVLSALEAGGQLERITQKEALTHEKN